MNFSLRLCEREDRSRQCSNSEPSGSSYHPPAAASFSPATPSAVSESIQASVGSSPITLPATLPTLILELRPLRSTGVTRLRRYFEPLRHLLWPSLSLAGFSLTVTHRQDAGFPCCIDLLGPHAIGSTPVRPQGFCCSVLSRQGQEAHALTTTAFPVIQAGRLSYPPFRRLLRVHSCSGLLTRGAAKAALSIEGFDSFVSSTAAPIATDWSNKLSGGIYSR